MIGAVHIQSRRRIRLRRRDERIAARRNDIRHSHLGVSAALSGFRSITGRTSPSRSWSFIAASPHAGSGGGLGRR